MNLTCLYNLFLENPVITTDSRKCTPGSIFFALQGDNFNGNKFAAQSLAAGCAYAVVDEKEYATDERIIYVQDCLKTLQALANYHRKTLSIPIIGITGTNGKTTTKELTSACLSRKYNVLCTEGNLNNHIGVPLTLLKINKHHEIAVIEMGANHSGEIKTLMEIAEPDFGLITNVGKAHLEGFGSFEGVIRTKCEMYDYLRQHNGHIFIQHENNYLQPQSQGLQKTEYGETPGLFLSGKLQGCSPYLNFSFTYKGNIQTVSTQLIGSYNLTNVLAAAAIASYFEVSSSDICQAIENYTPKNKRSQLQKTENNTLILDAYNANPTSMKAALDNFDLMDVSGKAVILGDMRELGAESEAEHQNIVDKLGHSSIEHVLLVGEEFSKVNGGFISLLTTEDLIDYLKDNPIKNCHILIKGSRGMQLEKCIDLL